MPGFVFVPPAIRSPTLRVAGYPLWPSFVHAIPGGACIPLAPSGCPPGAHRAPFVWFSASAPALSASPASPFLFARALREVTSQRAGSRSATGAALWR